MSSKSRMCAAVTAAGLFACVGAAQANLVFNNGLVNDFSGTTAEGISVSDNPSGPPITTTLNYLAGAANGDGFDLDVLDSSIVRMYAGSLVGDDLDARNNSYVEIWGGVISDDIRARDAAVIRLYGGSIGDTVAARESATLYIYGYDFNYSYGQIADQSGTISGFLSDGTAFSYGFDRGTAALGFTGTIELVYSVPAPAGLALLALGGLARSRRR